MAGSLLNVPPYTGVSAAGAAGAVAGGAAGFAVAASVVTGGAAGFVVTAGAVVVGVVVAQADSSSAASTTKAITNKIQCLLFTNSLIVSPLYSSSVDFYKF